MVLDTKKINKGLERLRDPKWIKALEWLREVNKDLFLPAFKENNYLVHTTPYYVMKDILQDGFLTGDKEHIRKTAKHKLVMHPGQVCFSSLPERHLSSLPNMPMIMVSHDTYLKIPFDYLRAKYQIKPVLYDISWNDVRHMNGAWIQRIAKKECFLEEYGNELEDYFYDITWSIENEWRVNKRGNVMIPDSAEVGVSNPQQKRVVERLTDLPVHIDTTLRKLTSYQNKRYRMRRWFDTLLKTHGLKAHHLEWNVDKNEFKLYDVLPFTMELEKLNELEYSEVRRIRRVAGKKARTVLCLHFTKFVIWADRDFVIDLGSRVKGSSSPPSKFWGMVRKEGSKI